MAGKRGLWVSWYNAPEGGLIGDEREMNAIGFWNNPRLLLCWPVKSAGVGTGLDGELTRSSLFSRFVGAWCPAASVYVTSSFQVP